MREVIGIEVPRGIHTHICGIDLIRDSKTGEFYVLEDNVRTPSGIFLYVLENRLGHDAYISRCVSARL